MRENKVNRKIPITENDITRAVMSIVKTILKEDLDWNSYKGDLYRKHMLKAIEIYNKLKKLGKSEDEIDDVLLDDAGGISVEEIMDFIKENNLDINNIDTSKINWHLNDKAEEQESELEDDYRYYPSKEIKGYLKKIGITDDYFVDKIDAITAVENKRSKLYRSIEQEKRDILVRFTNNLIELIKKDTENND